MGFTPNQMFWIMQHDWYVPDVNIVSFNGLYIPTIRIRETWPCGYQHDTIASFIGNMQQLKAWAGY